ncbi:MAG: NAD(P)-dependent alcohol dehydrogenase [Gammaproteobacteria bacterium]|nr:NAD(P)-dependent alcohol dehydrogenase [Gammaproteobacteria bacterium]
MKAAIWTAYGSPEVLEVQDVATPTPKNNEILVKIVSSAVTTGDCRMRRFDVPSGLWLPTRLAFGVFKPRKNIIGMDFSGEVVAAGKGVSLFKKGDRVFGTAGMALGANSEYICIAENKAVIKIPDSISHIDAVSLIFGGITALHFLKGMINEGRKVLINGASGSVGSAAVQISKNNGGSVTGICSGSNRELVLSLGADDVIDYTRSNFIENGVVYDVILDTVGNLSYSMCKGILSKSGKLILINAGLMTMLGSLINGKLICGVALESKELLHEIVELFVSKKLRSVIDKVYSLEEIIEAHEYVDKGRKKGNVVLTIG